MCFGGVAVNPSAHGLVTCSTCGGEGEIDPTAICACGRHATFRKDGYSYCGRQPCLEHLKDDARMDAVRTKYSYGDDSWHGFGGV